MENTAMAWQPKGRRKEIYQKQYRKVVVQNKGGHNSGRIAGRE